MIMSHKLLILCILCLTITGSYATVRNTEDLDDIVYDCNVIPSSANPVWDLAAASPDESTIVTASNGVLNINDLYSLTSYAGYWLPGQWGT